MASRQTNHEDKADESPGRVGIFGSIGKSVRETYEQVKEAVVATKHPDTDEYHDYGTGKARDVKDSSAKNTAVGDYAKKAESEEKDAIGGRMAELKESAAVAARRAMDLFTGKTREVDRKALEGGDRNEEKYGESEFSAREKMQELKLKEKGVYDEEKQRAAADWETAAERGIAARKNIYGAVGSLKEAIKDKLTYPTDIVQEAQASREYGGPKRAEKEKLVDEIKGPSGPAAFPSGPSPFQSD